VKTSNCHGLTEEHEPYR